MKKTILALVIGSFVSVAMADYGSIDSYQGKAASILNNLADLKKHFWAIQKLF